MTAQPTTEFRAVPGFPYEVNRKGQVRHRQIRKTIKGTQISGTSPWRRGYMMGHDGPQKTARSLVALAFGADAVPSWRYHIITHPELKVHKGESNGNHVMTAEQVRDLRAKYASGGWSHRKLAAAFGICRATVNQILQKQTWRHIL